MVLGKRNVRLIILLAGLGVILLLGGMFLFAPRSQGCHSGASRAPETNVVKRVRPTAPGPTPEGTLLATDGSAIAPAEIWPRRKVAIVVMKGTWCPVCRAEVDRLEARAHEIWGAESVVAVLTDHTPERNLAFVHKTRTPFPVLADPDHDQLAEWGLYRSGMNHPVPGVVFLDENGEVVKIHRGRYPGRDQGDMILETLRGD